MPPDGLAAALDLASGGDKEQRVFLRADKSIDYDALMRTLNVLRGAGYLKVALMGLDQGSGPGPSGPRNRPPRNAKSGGLCFGPRVWLSSWVCTAWWHGR